MSFPNGPDFDLNRCISRKDAILRIIDAITHVEVSLSKLADAKKEKVNLIFKMCDRDALSFQDINNINRGMNRLIEIIRHLHILLSFMLEDIQDSNNLTKNE
jgi:hypothetical protein